MAKRRTGGKVANPGSGRTERARDTLGALGSGSRLVSRMLPFVVAARRFRSPWSRVRGFERASVAARRLDHDAGRQTPPRERVRLASSLARAVEAGSRLPRVIADKRSARPTPLRLAPTPGVSAAPREDRSGLGRERRVERTGSWEPRARRHEPDLAMADAVRHATELDKVLAARERYALGLSYGIHALLERSLWSARRLSRGRSGRRDVMPVVAHGAMTVSDEHQSARGDGVENSPAGVGLGVALSHFAGAIRVLGRRLKGAAAYGASGGRLAGARIPSHASVAIRSAARVGSTRALPAPLLLAAPVVTAAEHRSRGVVGRASGQVVINSSPTVVVNNADSTSNIGDRVLEALRTHRRALYEQWHRELETRLRSEF